MELLKRQHLKESNNIVKLGTNFEREFSLTSNIIKFSFMLPLIKLREVDYFKIRSSQINKLKEFEDIVFIENGIFKLTSVDVTSVIMMNGKHEDFAKLSYSGEIKECKRPTLSFNPEYTLEYITTSSDWSNTRSIVNNSYIRTLY